MAAAVTLSVTGACGDDGGEVHDVSDSGPSETHPEVAKLEVLLVIDRANSLRDEQAELHLALPGFLAQLASGSDLDGDGHEDVGGATDIRFAVVSSSLGLPGLTGIPGCANLGDEARFNTTPNPELAACAETSLGTEPFIRFDPAADDAERVARDLGCIAGLGANGCFIEMQLESALKSVWPADDDSLSFVARAAGAGATGLGGAENGDFIRPASDEEPSAIAIILITDEDDCSSSAMDHLQPDDGTLAADSPLKMQGLNTRCFFEARRDLDPDMPGAQNNLYPVARYIESFRQLRKGREELVLFAAIAGVPAELVEREDYAAIDMTSAEETNAFYDRVLDDPAMRQVIDDRGTADVADDNYVPACFDGGLAEGDPPRRIVQVARAFGENGIVQSLCQPDLGPQLELIGERIASMRRARP